VPTVEVRIATASSEALLANVIVNDANTITVQLTSSATGTVLMYDSGGHGHVVLYYLPLGTLPVFVQLIPGQPILVPDLPPSTGCDPIIYFPMSGMTAGAVATTHAPVVTGLRNPLNVAIVPSTSSYSINGGPFVSSGGFITEGQTLMLQSQASMDPGGIVDVMVYVGLSEHHWVLTTYAPPVFAFTNVTNAELATNYQTETITVNGIDNFTPVVMTPFGFSMSIDGGPFTNTGSINPGQTLAIRGTSWNGFNRTVSVSVTIGHLNTTWSIVTKAA
jgi:hypothetical protein